MGQVILLRTLTEKSILGFGKYAEMSIRQILDLHKSVYLRWIYYNLSGITFTDEILSKIFIRKSYRIPKPGKNPALNEELLTKLWNNMDYKQQAHNKRRTKAEAKTSHMQLRAYDNVKFSKGRLAWKNQGHKMN